MTTEGEQSPAEQKEAVCGTCGGDGIVFRKPWHDPVHTCDDCNGTGCIPAPVVPSDERCECKHTISSHESASDLDALYPRKAPHRRGHCSACCDPEDGGSDYCDHDYAPPTPSQDAEGDGWRLVSRDSGGSLWTADDDPHYYEYVQAGIESAIRAPYEALVKAARVLRDAELRLISTPYEMRQSWDEANDARARAYVVLDNAFREYDARIEESLGGRKDG